MNWKLQDWTAELRFASRSLRRSPGFALTAILSLALGVALTASTLSVLNSYLVRAMPFPAADRLYRVLYDNSREPEPHQLELIDWNSLRDVVEVADSSKLARYVLQTESYPQEIFALLCAPGCAEALGVQATVGRSLNEADFRSGSEHVALISHAMWQERFGGDRQAIGKTVRATAANSGVTPTEYRIIGVLPPGFRYAGNFLRAPADIVVPLTMPSTVYLARLRQGVPAAFAERRITQAVQNVATAIPPGWTGVRLESMQANYVRELRPVLVGTTAAAALVLVIVVMNVTVLMLLRALRRQKETAVRVALGAERGHIARLLVMEAILICGVAMIAGLGLSGVVLHSVAPIVETRLGRPVPGGVAALNIDWHVLGWIGIAGLLMIVAVACLPMVGARPRGLADALRREGRSGTDRPALRRARNVLIALQVAASTALLIGSGLMVRTVVHLSRTPLGFVTEQVFRPRIQLPERTYPSDDHASFNRYYDRLNEQLAAVPNVSYALSTFVPFWEPPKQPIGTEDKIAAETRASVTAGGPDYFQTLGIGLRAGRAFTAMDREGSEPVAIISESLAHSLGPQGALGRRIRLREGSGNTAIDVWRTIIGVVHDVHQTHADTDLRDVYIPFAQTKTRFASVYLRGQGSADQWLEKLRTLSAAIDPEVLIGPAPPLAIQAETELAGPRFVTTILSAFAAFAAALALMGIFAVTAYAVQQRQREIAIRMAVGATSSAVIRMFLRRSGLVLLAGILAGLFGGAVVSRILQSQLHGVGRFDAWTLTVAAGLLMFAGLIATWIPTRRGAQADPMTILRAE